MKDEWAEAMGADARTSGKSRDTNITSRRKWAATVKL